MCMQMLYERRMQMKMQGCITCRAQRRAPPSSESFSYCLMKRMLLSPSSSKNFDIP